MYDLVRDQAQDHAAAITDNRNVVHRQDRRVIIV